MKDDSVIKNISVVKNCYGCGVCTSVCTRKVIDIRLNEDGFYEPYLVNGQSCTNCGLCRDVCSYLHNKLPVSSTPQACFAAWSNDDKIRQNSSSGGIGFEIGRQLIEKGYKAVGCRYDAKKQVAEHFIASTVDEYAQSIGSKYIQSYTKDAFLQIDRKQKYFITGTPCQIDSFRRMIQRFHCEENFVLMDFFCHSIPSMLAWKSYVKMMVPRTGEIEYVSWRNKQKIGWHNSYSMLIKGKKETVQSPWAKGDMFFSMFLGDLCLGPHCQNACKYKYDKSSADIRIGDLWGSSYQNDELGVNALIAFTERGKEIVEDLSNVVLVKHSFRDVAEGQMKTKAKAKEINPFVVRLLKKGVPLDDIRYKILLFIQRVITRIKIITNI